MPGDCSTMFHVKKYAGSAGVKTLEERLELLK